MMQHRLDVLLAAAGSRGDAYPMIALAARLRARGHRARVAAAPDYEGLASRVGVPFVPTGRSVESWLAGHAHLLARPASFVRACVEWLRTEVQAQLVTLGDVAREADLLVGCSVLFAGPTLADAAGRPYRHVTFCPQALPSRAHPPPAMPWQCRRGTVNAGLWRLQRGFLNHAIRGLLNAERSRIGLSPIGDVYGDVARRGVLVACDAALAGVPADVATPHEQTGPWRVRVEGRLPAAVEAFLAGGDAPVFVGFGSMMDPDPEATASLVGAALARLGRRGLLALRGPTPIRAGADAHVLRVGELPHEILFPRTAAVVHHGGAGTTATAARAARPQVVVPHLLDQYFWAKRVHALGVGPRPIWRARLSVERLVRALRPCLEDGALAGRARALAASLDPRDGLDLACATLEQAAGVPLRPGELSRSSAARG
jgi:UDP:flavonoid glycosyltransferase YjiC (YdhE family)